MVLTAAALGRSLLKRLMSLQIASAFFLMVVMNFMAVAPFVAEMVVSKDSMCQLDLAKEFRNGSIDSVSALVNLAEARYEELMFHSPPLGQPCQM